MLKFGYIINEEAVTLQFSNGDIEILPLSRAKDVLNAIKDGKPESEIKELANKAKVILDYMSGTVVISQGQVLYNGNPVHGVLVNKILEFHNKGYPYKPLVAFLEHLFRNPSYRAVNELYGFLSEANLAITESGTFLAYKAIQNNWTDRYTGKFDNHVGQTLEMPRNTVDDNCNRGCSYGFHVGSLRYVNSFKSSGDRVVIVEVDPADVVSVPIEDCGKVRVCKYKVVGEYTGPLAEFVPDEEPDGPDYDDDDEDEFDDDPDPEYRDGDEDPEV